MKSKNLIAYFLWVLMGLISIATAYSIHQLLIHTGYVTFWHLKDVIELYGLVSLLMMGLQMFLIIKVDEHIHRKK